MGNNTKLCKNQTPAMASSLSSETASCWQRGWRAPSKARRCSSLGLVKAFIIALVLFDVLLASSSSSSSTPVGPKADTFQENQGPADNKGVNPSDDPSAVIELLRPSSLQRAPGVKPYSPTGWQLSPSFAGISVQQGNRQIRKALRMFRGDFAFKFSGILSDQSQGPLLRISSRTPGHSASLPRLEISVDLPGDKIVLRYLGARSFQRVTLGHVFPEKRWMTLEVSVRRKDVTVTVDCKSTSFHRLGQIVGALPSDAEVSFGVRSGGQQGLQGIVFSATLFTNTHVPPNTCEANAGSAVSDEPASGATSSDVQSDDSAPGLSRLVTLEQKFVELSLTVQTLQQQNQDLRERVSHLETCECRPSCSHNGTLFQDGETWTPEPCTQCTCVKDKAECAPRFDIPSCTDPCLNNPCMNNGECLKDEAAPSVGSEVSTQVTQPSYTCECPPPFDGANCEVRQNPCVWPADPGPCDQQINRFYYDILSQQCLPFIFSGCGGNVNNYYNIEECTNIAMRGACCSRSYKTSIQDVKNSTQELEIDCKELHIVECKALHRQPSGDDSETEVISFNPGLTCQEASCQTVGTCVVGQRVYQEGDYVTLGCQSCTCKPMGIVDCRCEKVSERKEIRDMTQAEIARFQAAVAELRRSEDRTWEQFRDQYMYHVMHATGGPFFLPWQRAFLRQLEQRLQEVDCAIVLPYFDFTTDVGFFEEAIIWQPNYFGGNGDGRCVQDHRFGTAETWRPCLVRNFNTSIRLPTQLELQIALASDSFEDMSLCLETYIAYVHNFIGGDMMTSSSPYDPVFYALHAYIDMLYWRWQQREPNRFKFPAAFGNIPMIPFNIPPRAVLNSEADVCVTYLLPSKGHPCNLTSTTPLEPDSGGVRRGDIDPRTLYGQQGGESAQGVDAIDPYAYSNNGTGYNRDGYDKNGLDMGGYNRYGLDVDGYDRYGFNTSGLDRDGKLDSTGRFDQDGYDMDCLNRQGLTRDGFDQYGFNLDGLDRDGCTFYFNGPFSPLHSYHLIRVLGRQPKHFLMTLARTCTGLAPLPTHWLHLNWVAATKDVSTMVPVRLPEMQTGVSSRFCFDTRPFLTSCECDLDAVTCEENPCVNSTCEAFPEAECRIDLCEGCQAKWYHMGRSVDCGQIRDHCIPSPCQNGGTCKQSIWENEPHLVTCDCPPGYDGNLCQHQVADPCILPLRTGSCNNRKQRWYYNQQSGKCEQFVYLGCGGNANNFPTFMECQSRCVKGSCCTRRSKVPTLTIGFDSQGYDRYGFNVDGYNRFGDRRTVENSSPTGTRLYDEAGYDWQGFDRKGYGGEDGLNRAGYNREGYSSEGFNITGYSSIGEYDGIIDYDEYGYDAEGYNRAGLSCHGYDREGFDIYSVASAYLYRCDVTTEGRCYERARSGEEVVKFTPGRACPEQGCDLPCHCRTGNRTFTVYQKFHQGCQICTCTEIGSVKCDCTTTFRRKEVRDMSRRELKRYQEAVRNMTEDRTYPSEWYKLAALYAKHKPLAVGNPLFLPWNRQFLRHVELILQEQDCDIAIPYYDWTVDAGKPYKSLVWAANVFGGDGAHAGNDRSECVRYHPFKNYYPPYLSPCLRRHFNANISLPTAVNVELALRDPDFERFRIQVEFFLRTFQTFVGGHMDSDFAPYDPLFLSVAAFVDKLWVQWQERHPRWILDFPLNHRYARMDPFKTTPDDVFDSRNQLCVEYVPIGDGVPCVIRETIEYGYNPRGYDRHGFNRQGFDSDGYDIEGFDRSGRQDTRGKYNQEGFDRDGFRRNGYDSSGIDRFGFFIDSYNLDDFDSSGYDRSGYNRYGFNEEGFTPYGYNSNGSFLPNINIKELGIFDEYGYNKYGYNAEGFDRNGYDVFGFDSRGFDRKECNYYSIGPIYILVKQYAERALKDLNDTGLNNVKRICSQLNPLPDYVVRRYWLDRLGQKQLLNEVYDYQINRNMIDTRYMPRETSVTTDPLWLPMSPDERLCIVTEVYTNCRIGEAHLMCPEDLCADRTCPGKPNAVCRVNNCGTCKPYWYDGLTGQELICSGCVDSSLTERREDERWPDEACSSCVCREGRVVCGREPCPNINCKYPIQEPNDCCPTCDGCYYEGQVVLSGRDFRLDGDPCTTCHCQAGNVTCSKVECPDLRECRSEFIQPGTCCPVCQDCGNRASGERWRPDPCQDCICQSGEVRCERTVCERLTCQHPVRSEGECCSVCSDCLYQGRLRRNGEEFSTDPCNLCTCRNGSVSCDTVACPDVTCDRPVTAQGQCCPGCNQDCEYEDQTFKDGTVFQPNFNPCYNCSCTNSLVQCRPIRCPQMDPPCRSPIRRPGECCATVCLTCEDGGIVYQDGESWPSLKSPCDVCTCRGGKVECRPRQNCPRSCSHGIVGAGQCCSDCTDCLVEGQMVREGEVLTLTGGDVCRQCLCRAGNAACQVVQQSRDCPRLRCRNTITPEGECCPVCAGCIFEGQEFRDGQVVSRDECSICICREGEVMCDSERDECPPLNCRNPVTPPGQCCPICTSCIHQGLEYRDGDSFTLPEDGCRKCTCNIGRLSCVDMTEDDCPAVQCTHPGKRRNQCCPTCNSCRYRRRMVRNGQRFTDPGDICEKCQCEDGSVICQRTDCPAIRCSNPVTLPGECCPVCASVCTFEGTEYTEGERFKRPLAECETCICENGRVSCKPEQCDTARCRHPAKLPGECCPICDFCLFDKKIFRNQQRFVHPKDMCQQCACEFGTVTCDQTTCPALQCLQPMPMAGSCCPVCPKQCTFQGLKYDDGETFVNPRDKCEDCICRQDSVQCKMRMCPPVDCANPVIGDCCPMCSDCTYGTLLIRDGETAPDPDDPCQMCQCIRGTMRCRSVTCQPVLCSDPAQDGCCPVCDDCQVRGRRYRNGDVITDNDRCQTCRCIDGNVQCQSQVCPPARCTHPAREACCQECRNCEYQGRQYREGEIFRGANVNLCQDCTCTKGNVRCKRISCPAVVCTHPVHGRCCPACTDCQVDGQVVREGAIAPPSEDPCQECRCLMGSLVCQQKQCPTDQRCRHPVVRECCQECSDCLYRGKEYRNGETFSDPASDCIACQCSYGTVQCRQKSCPEISCSNPVQGECCLECEGCSYNGRIYENRKQFPHPTDRCQTCDCEFGDIHCSAVDCTAERTCTHPVTKRGDCCPSCGSDCFYKDRLVTNGEKVQEIFEPSQKCQTCICREGNMRCSPLVCPRVTCTHPQFDGCCEICRGCKLDGILYLDGQTFRDPSSDCSKCTCQAGSIRCERVSCSPVSCKHPEIDRCCPLCRNCEIDGMSLINGQRFINRDDSCQLCICEFGTVSCNQRSCPASSVSCPDPGRDNCGCRTCDACTYKDRPVPNGEMIADPEDPCRECFCRDGTITCREQPCPRQCSHSATTAGCCPRCDDCLYEGSVRLEGQSFVSVSDPCQKCTCQQGSVTCDAMDCPRLPCLNPIRMDGECCPSCPMCLYLGETYQDNQRFTHPQDPCQICSCKMGRVQCEKEQCAVTCSHPRPDRCCPKCDMCSFEDVLYENGASFQPDDCRLCSCRDGNVVCDEQSCPSLLCSAPKKIEGQCCEVCQGCTFHGILYDEAASWVMPESVCTVCSCHDGLVTCMAKDCFAPCPDPITPPGQCCPECPTCNFNGIMYSDGQEFSPNGDPCDICICQEGRLRCEHNNCPNTANCPGESIRQPEPGTCCSTCVEEFTTGCTVADLGKITKPRAEDPCFFCECKEDFMWICMKEECPVLTCPPDVQMYNAGECCPKCPSCFDVSDASYHHEGSRWLAAEDPCIACACSNGQIECEMRECDPIRCEDWEQAVVPEGQCCQICQAMPDASCFYKGSSFLPGEEWAADECTTCLCRGGQVSCNVRQCPLLSCKRDEVPMNTPGQCCPICKKEPGTCLVFGDPHYRTFDGATLHFQGTCRYIMAKDCANDLFSVEVQHDSRGVRGEVAWAQNLTVLVAGAKVDLLQNLAVQVNGQNVELPYLYEPHILVEVSGKSLLLTTQIGLRVLWDGSHYGEIIVPGTFKRKLCGLCGNFNSFPQDDLRTRTGQITNSAATFGNSWKASTQINENCVDATDVNPCMAAGYRARKLAISKCAILKSAPFARCHRVVPPDPYLSSCVYDLCVCMRDPDCLCDIVATYAHECARAGVKVQWRSQDMCAFSCDASKGLVFDECGPVCPRTCENIQVQRVLQGANNTTSSSGESASTDVLYPAGQTCFKPCVASCQCTADKVLHEGECIDPEDCPRIEEIRVL